MRRHKFVSSNFSPFELESKSASRKIYRSTTAKVKRPLSTFSTIWFLFDSHWKQTTTNAGENRKKQVSMITKCFTKFRCSTSTTDIERAGLPIEVGTSVTIEKIHIMVLANWTLKVSEIVRGHKHTAWFRRFDFQWFFAFEKFIHISCIWRCLTSNRANFCTISTLWT